MRVLSLFSGIGAFETALENIGMSIDIANFCEFDKFAVKSYCAIHQESIATNLGDITLVTHNELPADIDMITHGSPCQDFSVAGKGNGGDEGSGTRSSLMWNTVDIIEETMPKYVIWENVKNLLSKKHRHNFETYLEVLGQLGYNNYYEVLNTKHYGLPQNRERIFVVSIRKDVDTGFVFPNKVELKLRLKDLLEDEVDEKYYLKKTKDFFIKNSFDMEAKGNGFRFDPHVKDNADIAKCITTRAGGRMDDNYIIEGHYEGKTFKFDSTNDVLRIGGLWDTETRKRQAGGIYLKEGISPTLDTCCGGGHQPYITEEFRIRKLTPLECWRLQGFSDEQFYRAKATGMSDSQLYKQAGNSISVSVLEHIFASMFGDIKCDRLETVDTTATEGQLEWEL